MCIFDINNKKPKPMTTEKVQYYFENWQTYWPFLDQKIIAISGYPYCELEIDHYDFGPDILSKVTFDSTWLFLLMTNADPKAMLNEIARYVRIQKEAV